MSRISDVTILIGTITTSIGTVFGIGLSIYNITRREAQNFKIEVSEHRKIINPAKGYSDKKFYTNLRAINIGGRPLRISSAGFAFLNYDSGVVFSDSFISSNAVIEIDGVRDYFADETNRPNKKIAYYYASSITGKTKKKYVTPRLWVWTRNGLAKSKLWKKPPLYETKN